MHLISTSNGTRPLSALVPGASGTVHHVLPHQGDHVERLLALGVTPGAHVTLLQNAPGFVFLCDQTELAVERSVADVIVIALAEE